ncbi:MAG: C40 family peptidase, partial [Erysipelotrichaceae bacterium]|nr:C40 family peptidase [Erysipelotrichaceae bacterium]
IILFLVPMFLIVMMTVDFAKCVIASDVESMKKTFQLSIKRLLMAMALFLVPTIVSATMNLLGELNVEYASCINNATLERIAGLEADIAENTAASSTPNNNFGSFGDGDDNVGVISSGGIQSLKPAAGAKPTKGKCNKKGDYPSGNVKLVSTGKKNSAGFLIKQMEGDSEAINIINYGLRYIGYPYVLWGKGDLLENQDDYKKIENRAAKWNGTVTDYGIKKLIGKSDVRAFDCSGFVIYIYQQYGYFKEDKYKKLSSSSVTTVELFKVGKLVGKGNSALKKAKVGDLVLYGEPGSGHVAIYMGNNTLLHQTAGHPICGARGVTITTTNIGRTVNQVRRVIGVGTD